MQIIQSIHDPSIRGLIKSGAVGVLPTDTVYGLVCSATDEHAVERLYAAKHREHKPGTLVAGSVEQLVTLGIPARYLKAVERFWPGSVSVIIPVSGLNYLRQDIVGLAIRIPGDDVVRELLMHTGPLLTTSANQPGEPISRTLEEAQTYFGDTIDFYVDGGDLSGRPPSTVIRVIDDAIEVLREGAVKIDDMGRIAD